MVVTVMKTSYRKIEPLIINYRKYKEFSSEKFRKSVQMQFKSLSGNCDENFSLFVDNCNAVLDKQLPKKKKICERQPVAFYE